MSRGRAWDTKGVVKDCRGPKPRSATRKESIARRGRSHDLREDVKDEDRREFKGRGGVDRKVTRRTVDGLGVVVVERGGGADESKWRKVKSESSSMSPSSGGWESEEA